MNTKLLLEMGLLSCASLLQGAGFSLIAPFYPKEALDRVREQFSPSFHRKGIYVH